MLGAVTIFVVMAFAGLALDASYMYFHKRAMQTAADAGAYGGALELLRGNINPTSAAKNDTGLERLYRRIGQRLCHCKFATAQRFQNWRYQLRGSDCQSPAAHLVYACARL